MGLEDTMFSGVSQIEKGNIHFRAVALNSGWFCQPEHIEQCLKAVSVVTAPSAVCAANIAEKNSPDSDGIYPSSFNLCALQLVLSHAGSAPL